MIAGRAGRLPFGNIPRLLMAWVCTEAHVTQSRVLTLGIMSDSGGPRGERVRVRNQMERLFSASVSFHVRLGRGEFSVNSHIAEVTAFWWDTLRPQTRGLWQSQIYLGELFFREIIRNPVPLDMSILQEVRRSSLGLDLYVWLTYRTFGLKEDAVIPWRNLYRQFAANPSKVTDRRAVGDFRKECLRELKKISLAWKGLEWRTQRGALILRPSVPRIAPEAPPRGRQYSREDLAFP